MNKIFWLAGENSGDIHTAKVMHELNTQIKELEHMGIGGPYMQVEGLQPMFAFERFSVMGFTEVIQHLFFFWKVYNKIKQLFSKNPPDLVVLTDYPGLNLRIAKLAKTFDIPVLYYICPQFWAWKEKRLQQLKAYTDHVACILPFEKDHLEREKISSTYVGHPIAEELEVTISSQEFALQHSLKTDKKWIGFFPGSRNVELKRVLPVLNKTAKKFPSDQYELIFSCASSIDRKLFDKYIKDRDFKVFTNDNHALMKYSDISVITSGTATLEAAYLGTPFIIIYKTGAISYFLGKKLVKIDMIGLPNIVLQRSVIPEIIQHRLQAGRLHDEIMNFLTDQKKYETVKNELKHLHNILEKRSASKEVTAIIRELIGE